MGMAIVAKMNNNIVRDSGNYNDDGDVGDYVDIDDIDDNGNRGGFGD